MHRLGEPFAVKVNFFSYYAQVKFNNYNKWFYMGKYYNLCTKNILNYDVCRGVHISDTFVDHMFISFKKPLFLKSALI